MENIVKTEVEDHLYLPLPEVTVNDVYLDIDGAAEEAENYMCLETKDVKPSVTDINIKQERISPLPWQCDENTNVTDGQRKNSWNVAQEVKYDPSAEKTSAQIDHSDEEIDIDTPYCKKLKGQSRCETWSGASRPPSSLGLGLLNVSQIPSLFCPRSARQKKLSYLFPDRSETGASHISLKESSSQDNIVARKSTAAKVTNKKGSHVAKKSSKQSKPAKKSSNNALSDVTKPSFSKQSKCAARERNNTVYVSDLGRNFPRKVATSNGGKPEKQSVLSVARKSTSKQAGSCVTVSSLHSQTFNNSEAVVNPSTLNPVKPHDTIDSASAESAEHCELEMGSELDREQTSNAVSLPCLNEVISSEKSQSDLATPAPSSSQDVLQQSRTTFVFVEKSSKEISCPECCVEIAQCSLKDHLKTVHDLQLETCTKCKIGFTDVNQYSEHYAFHLQQEENHIAGILRSPLSAGFSRQRLTRKQRRQLMTKRKHSSFGDEQHVEASSQNLSNISSSAIGQEDSDLADPKVPSPQGKTLSPVKRSQRLKMRPSYSFSSLFAKNSFVPSKAFPETCRTRTAGSGTKLGSRSSFSSPERRTLNAETTQGSHVRTCTKCKMQFMDVNQYSEHYALHLQEEENRKAGKKSPLKRDFVHRQLARKRTQFMADRNNSGALGGHVSASSEHSDEMFSDGVTRAKHGGDSQVTVQRGYAHPPARKRPFSMTRATLPFSSKLTDGSSVNSKGARKTAVLETHKIRRTIDDRRKRMEPTSVLTGSPKEHSEERCFPSFHMPEAFPSFDLAVPGSPYSSGESSCVNETETEYTSSVLLDEVETASIGRGRRPRPSSLDMHSPLSKRQRLKDYAADSCSKVTVCIVSLEAAAQPFNCKLCLQAFHTALVCPESFRQFCQDRWSAGKPEEGSSEQPSPPSVLQDSPLSLDSASDADEEEEIREEDDQAVPVAVPKASVRPEATQDSRTQSPENVGAEKSSSYECRVCHERFQYHSELLKHAPYHSYQFACGFCQKAYQQKLDLFDHFEIAHGGKMQFRCKYCERKFTDLVHFHTHIKTHKDGTVVRCTVCNRKYSSSQQMLLHRKNSHGPCEVCGKTFLEEKLFVKHLRRVHTKPSEQHQAVAPTGLTCKMCARVFLTLTGLLSHKRHHRRAPSASPSSLSTETTRSDISTPQLSLPSPRKVTTSHSTKEKRSPMQSQPNVPTFRHSPSKVKPPVSQPDEIEHNSLRSGPRHCSSASKCASLRCRVCGKVMTSLQGLKSHYSHSHNGVSLPNHLRMAKIGGVHSCPKCDKHFFSPTSVFRHIRLVHGKACGSSKKVAIKQKLGVQKCRNCGKNFGSSLGKTFLAHTKLCHAKQSHSRQASVKAQPLKKKCRLCEKSFLWEKSLIRHMLITHQVTRKELSYNMACMKSGKQESEAEKWRLHVCNICKEGFTVRKSFKLHQVNRHKSKSGFFQCRICRRCFTRNSTLLEHIQKQHEGRPPFLCRGCSQEFDTSGDIFMHRCDSVSTEDCREEIVESGHESLPVRVKTEDPEYRYRCTACDVGFYIAHEWMNHMQEHYDRVLNCGTEKGQNVPQCEDKVNRCDTEGNDGDECIVLDGCDISEEQKAASPSIPLEWEEETTVLSDCELSLTDGTVRGSSQSSDNAEISGQSIRGDLASQSVNKSFLEKKDALQESVGMSLPAEVQNTKEIVEDTKKTHMVVKNNVSDKMCHNSQNNIEEELSLGAFEDQYVNALISEYLSDADVPSTQGERSVQEKEVTLENTSNRKPESTDPTVCLQDKNTDMTEDPEAFNNRLQPVARSSSPKEHILPTEAMIQNMTTSEDNQMQQATMMQGKTAGDEQPSELCRSTVQISKTQTYSMNVDGGEEAREREAGQNAAEDTGAVLEHQIEELEQGDMMGNTTDEERVKCLDSVKNVFTCQVCEEVLANKSSFTYHKCESSDCSPSVPQEKQSSELTQTLSEKSVNHCERTDSLSDRNCEQEDELLGKCSKGQEKEPLGESMKSQEEEPLGESMKSQEEEPLGESMKSQEEEPLGESMKSQEEEPSGESNKSQEGEPLGDSSVSQEDEPLGENSKSQEEEPLGESSKSQEEEPLGESMKSQEEEPLGKSMKRQEGEPLGESRKRQEDEPLGESSKSQEEEPLGESMKSQEEEPLGESMKSQEEEPLGDSMKSQEEEPLGDSMKSQEEEPLGDSSVSQEEEPLGESMKSQEEEPLGDSSMSQEDDPIGESRKREEDHSVQSPCKKVPCDQHSSATSSRYLASETPNDESIQASGQVSSVDSPTATVKSSFDVLQSRPQSSHDEVELRQSLKNGMQNTGKSGFDLEKQNEKILGIIIDSQQENPDCKTLGVKDHKTLVCNSMQKCVAVLKNKLGFKRQSKQLGKGEQTAHSSEGAATSPVQSTQDTPGSANGKGTVEHIKRRSAGDSGKTGARQESRRPNIFDVISSKNALHCPVSETVGKDEDLFSQGHDDALENVSVPSSSKEPFAEHAIIGHTSEEACDSKTMELKGKGGQNSTPTQNSSDQTVGIFRKSCGNANSTSPILHDQHCTGEMNIVDREIDDGSCQNPVGQDSSHIVDEDNLMVGPDMDAGKHISPCPDLIPQTESNCEEKDERACLDTCSASPCHESGEQHGNADCMGVISSDRCETYSGTCVQKCMEDSEDRLIMDKTLSADKEGGLMPSSVICENRGVEEEKPDDTIHENLASAKRHVDTCSSGKTRMLGNKQDQRLNIFDMLFLDSVNCSVCKNPYTDQHSHIDCHRVSAEQKTSLASSGVEQKRPSTEELPEEAAVVLDNMDSHVEVLDAVDGRNPGELDETGNARKQTSDLSDYLPVGLFIRKHCTEPQHQEPMQDISMVVNRPAPHDLPHPQIDEPGKSSSCTFSKQTERTLNKTDDPLSACGESAVNKCVVYDDATLRMRPEQRTHCDSDGVMSRDDVTEKSEILARPVTSETEQNQTVGKENQVQNEVWDTANNEEPIGVVVLEGEMRCIPILQKVQKLMSGLGRKSSLRCGKKLQGHENPPENSAEDGAERHTPETPAREQGESMRVNENQAGTSKSVRRRRSTQDGDSREKQDRSNIFDILSVGSAFTSRAFVKEHGVSMESHDSYSQLPNQNLCHSLLHTPDDISKLAEGKKEPPVSAKQTVASGFGVVNFPPGTVPNCSKNIQSIQNSFIPKQAASAHDNHAESELRKQLTELLLNSQLDSHQSSEDLSDSSMTQCVSRFDRADEPSGIAHNPVNTHSVPHRKNTDQVKGPFEFLEEILGRGVSESRPQQHLGVQRGAEHTVNSLKHAHEEAVGQKEHPPCRSDDQAGKVNGNQTNRSARKYLENLREKVRFDNDAECSKKEGKCVLPVRGSKRQCVSASQNENLSHSTREHQTTPGENRTTSSSHRKHENLSHSMHEHPTTPVENRKSSSSHRGREGEGTSSSSVTERRLNIFDVLSENGST